MVIFNILVLVSFATLSINRVESNLFIILLQSSQILTGFRELSLFHALSNIPMNKSSLGIHEVKLVVEPGPGLGDGRRVGEHAHSSLDLGQVTPRHHGGRLVVDSHLEPSGTPVHELDAPLGLDGGDGGVDILGDNISSVEKTTCHVLPMARIALDHLVGGFETSVGDLSHGQLLMVSLLRGNHGGVGHKGEMDPGVGNQISLELSQIHVESAVKSQRGRDGGDDLSNEPVEIGVGGAFNVQVPAADVIDGFVIDHKGTVRVFQGGVGGQDGVVRLHDSGRDLGSGVNGKLQFGFLAVVHGETLHEKRSETRSGSTSEGMKEKESLKSSASISQFPDSVKYQ